MLGVSHERFRRQLPCHPEDEGITTCPTQKEGAEQRESSLTECDTKHRRQDTENEARQRRRDLIRARSHWHRAGSIRCQTFPIDTDSHLIDRRFTEEYKCRRVQQLVRENAAQKDHERPEHLITEDGLEQIHERHIPDVRMWQEHDCERAEKDEAAQHVRADE